MGFAKVIVFFAKRHFPDERNLDQPPHVDLHSLPPTHTNLKIHAREGLQGLGSQNGSLQDSLVAHE